MILSLRDEALARQDCDRLRSFQVSALEAPVHRACPMAFDAAFVDAAAGFILTSQQAAYALPDTGRERPVFTVGRASAAAARHQGYHNIYAGTSDGAGLAEMIKAQAKAGIIRQSDRLIWLRATRISTDMITALQDDFTNLSQAITYQMEEAKSLPSDAVTALQQGQVTAIMVLSKAQLGGLVTLLHHHDLWQVRDKIALYCVSQAVADAAHKQGWQAVNVARRKRALSVQAAVIVMWHGKRAENGARSGCRKHQ